MAYSMIADFIITNRAISLKRSAYGETLETPLLTMPYAVIVPDLSVGL